MNTVPIFVHGGHALSSTEELPFQITLWIGIALLILSPILFWLDNRANKRYKKSRKKGL